MHINRYEHIRTASTTSHFAQRLWDSGQSLLAAGRYVAARRELEAAEHQAFLRHNAVLLAGIYLPLLEAVRQIRQLCCDGIIAIIAADQTSRRHAVLELATSGGVWLELETGRRSTTRSCGKLLAVADVPFEFLRLSLVASHWYLTAHGDQHLGIPVIWTTDPGHLIAPAAPENMVAILPPPGIYRPGDPQHAQARETLFLVWEALALGWLGRRHRQSDGWEALAILRQARKIDPACERILMQMMALAESLI
ncbi:MAG: hypothetical protein ACP5VQ_01435 [Phycisphaerae bacterium]